MHRGLAAAVFLAGKPSRAVHMLLALALHMMLLTTRVGSAKAKVAEADGGTAAAAAAPPKPVLGTWSPVLVKPRAGAELAAPTTLQCACSAFMTEWRLARTYPLSVQGTLPGQGAKEFQPITALSIKCSNGKVLKVRMQLQMVRVGPGEGAGG